MQTIDDLVLDDLGRSSYDEAFAFAQRYLVEGMTSPGRRRAELGGKPFLVSRGEGAYLWDQEGNQYIDLNAGHGAALVGHSHPAIKAALYKGIDMGILAGQETIRPAIVAKGICELVPSAERVRLMFTGTEATALAIRIARGYTGKLGVLKFEGHYHGQNDALQYNIAPPLDKAGPREAPVVRGESAGVIPENAGYAYVLPWNDLGLLEDLLKRAGDRIGAVIMEPINLNSGGIMPRPGYLEGVRELTRQHNSVLIFDEILSGFRTGPDCAQGLLGVTPDLTTLGKALGGGLPLAAVAGRKEVMDALAPVGKVINQGTYYGQVLVMHAAAAFLELARDPANWEHQKKLEGQLYTGLQDIFARYRAGHIQPVGNRYGMFFGIEDPVWEYRQAAKVDRDMEFRFYTAAFKHRVYYMHSWHHGFGWAHTEQDIAEGLDRTESAMRDAAQNR